MLQNYYIFLLYADSNLELKIQSSRSLIKENYSSSLILVWYLNTINYFDSDLTIASTLLLSII